MIYVLEWAPALGRWAVVLAAEARNSYLDPDGFDRWQDVRAANDAADVLNGQRPGWWKRS